LTRINGFRGRGRYYPVTAGPGAVVVGAFGLPRARDINDTLTLQGELMKFGILVNEGPYTHQAADTAYLFAKAVLEKGHTIHRVFFYHDGVHNSSNNTEPPQDDRHIVNRWTKLAEEHEIDLVVCVAAALRRGIKDNNLAEGFRISGLGQLIETGIQADRLVTFGD
jgi:tRNA 2-thiouridine synthesizing protein D